jgi:hypothetical protein
MIGQMVLKFLRANRQADEQTDIHGERDIFITFCCGRLRA